MKPYFYVYYVEDGIAKLKKFKTLKGANVFIIKFSKQADPHEGSWIDFVFEGTILKHFEAYTKVL